MSTENQENAGKQGGMSSGSQEATPTPNEKAPQNRPKNPIQAYTDHAGSTETENAGEKPEPEAEKPEAKIAKDGRRMNANSLKNLTAGPRWKPGESGNPAGPGKDPVKLFKAELTEILREPSTRKADKTELRAILDKAIERYYNTKNDATFLRLYELFVDCVDGNIKDGQLNGSGSPVQNVLILPAQNPPIDVSRARRIDPPDED